jgi:peptidoglycan/xylan/chitin deacetylase (PgdA/CDA1 family)
MIILHGDANNKEVTLLFDDGPNPAITPKLLQVLADKNVTANFFLIGMRVEQSPEIAEQIVAAGHEVGNHTYTHKRLPQVLEEEGEAGVIAEVVKGKAAIENATGLDASAITFLRPPYLDWNDAVEKIVKPIYGDNVMMSDLAVGDWDWGKNHVWDENDKESIETQANRITTSWKQILSNGTLLGFHDSSEHNLPGNKQFDTWMNRALPTLAAIPHIIDYLHEQGYEIKRLSDMNLVKEQYANRQQSSTKA